MADTAPNAAPAPPADPSVNSTAPLGAPVPTEAAVPSAAPPSPAAPAAPAPEDDDATVSMPQSAFKDRVRRDANQLVQSEYGGLTPAQVKQQAEQLAAIQKEQEDAKLAQMDENEQLKHKLAAAEGERDAAFEERDQARIEHQISSTCVQLGITNVGYATHLLAEHASTLAENDEFDEAEVLKGILQDEAQAKALGIAPEPTKVADPATTTLGPGGAPTPPPAGGAPKGAGDVQGMSEAEWKQKKSAWGI